MFFFIRLTVILLAMLFGPARPGSAQPALDSDVLRAEQLVSGALNANRGLAALQAAVREAAARQSYAGVLDDPELSWDTMPGMYTSQIDEGQNVRLSQRIPWPGTLGHEQQRAAYQHDARSHRLAAARLEVEALARQAWAEWSFIHQALAVNADNMAVLEDLRSSVETRYAAGEARQQDVLRVEQERSHLQHQRIGYQRQQRSLRAQINALLNRPADAPLSPPAQQEELDPLPSLPGTLAQELHSHPQLGELRSSMASDKVGVELARLDAYPDFRLTTGYNTLWREVDKRWMVGLSLNIPLDQSKRRAAVDEAEARRIRSQWRLEEKQAQLEAQLVSAHAAAEESLHLVRLYRNRLLPLARETLNASLVDYRSGAGEFLNVIDAEQQRLRAELELIRARADYLRHLAELNHRAGGDLSATATSAGDSTNE